MNNRRMSVWNCAISALNKIEADEYAASDQAIDQEISEMLTEASKSKCKWAVSWGMQEDEVIFLRNEMIARFSLMSKNARDELHNASRKLIAT